MLVEHTDCKITWDRYNQPYPVCLIELPDDYRKILYDKFKIPVPIALSSFQSIFMITCFYYGGTGEDVANFFKLDPTKIVSDLSQSTKLEEMNDNQAALLIHLNKLIFNFSMIGLIQRNELSMKEERSKSF